MKKNVDITMELIYTLSMKNRPQVKNQSNNTPGSFTSGGFLICGLVTPTAQDFKRRPHETIKKV